MVQQLSRGAGALRRLPDMLEKVGIRKPLVVCSRSLTPQLQSALGFLPHVLFQAYHPNPDFLDCTAGRDLYRAEGCDGLVSLGGGSAMDTAKGIKALLLAPNDEAALANTWEAAPLPHVAIPATAGTGSEATAIAVMYVDGVKHSLDHPALLPEGVLLDPELLTSLPLYHKKACALDALCQGIESFWAKKATEDSQVDAFLAFTGVLDNLKAYLAGDPHAAAEVQYAAYRSGCAIAVSRTTAAHAMSYRLTKRYGLAHGHACMLTLPAIWEAMLDDTEVLPTLMDLAQKMRLGSELLGPKLLRGILYDLDMPFPPAPDAEALDDLTRSVNVQRLQNNPRVFTAEEIRAIYRRSMVSLCGSEKQACLDIWRYYGA